MNIIPVLSAFFVTSATAITHSCDFLNPNEVHIGSDEAPKHLRLMKIDSSRINQQKFDAFFRASEKDYRKGINSFSSSPGAVDLGMSDVPVLDQGQFGTCVTFSSTAALDARVGKGDFISQECSLALDKTLGDDWWNGAYYPSQIIDPLRNHGVVEKSRCPMQYPDNSYSISVADYESLADKEASQAVKAVNYVYSAKADLNAVKAALRAGHRVLMAFTLDGNSQEAIAGFNVKVDGVAYQGGLWACKQGVSQNHCVKSNAGHEVLVIGYDDVQQLLKIRNSWSEQYGNKGDWYMSFTFFNSMAVDTTQVL